MDAIQLTHISRMDTLGGIERLLQAFVNVPDTEIQHALFLTGKKIHPALRPENRNIPVHYSRYALGCYLPKSIRRFHSTRTLASLRPDVISFWGYPTTRHDQIQFPSSARLIYQEHGSGWDMEISARKQDFLNRMDAITCCSYAAQRILELRWQCRNPITVVRNPIPPHALPPCPQPKTAPHLRPLILGTAGRLVPYKATVLTLFALKKLLDSGVDVQLRIAGTGPLLNALETATLKLGVRNSVEFCGALTDMASFYRSLDLFLLPSIREPLGLVAAEAMAHGCPVIATSVDGIPEAVTDGKTGLCIRPELTLPQFLALAGTEFNGKFPEAVYDPFSDSLCAPRTPDPDKLADAVIKLVSEPERYEAMSRAAMDQATNFSFQTYFSALKAALLASPVTGQEFPP